MNVKDDRWCFACGVENPFGLRLSDIRLEAQDCVCTFAPEKHHQGWADVLHGGITSTLLDEIMTHGLYRRGFDAVTAEMTVRFRQRVLVGQTLTVRSRITQRRGKFAVTEGELLLEDGSVGASATAKYFISERGPDVPGGRVSLAAREDVIFDLFGTLAPVFHVDEYSAVLRQMGPAVGVDPDEFIRAFKEDAHRRTRGHWPSLEANVADVVKRLGLDVGDDQIRRCAAIREEYSRRHLMNPYPDALEALQALRDAGRRIGLVSDCSPETPAIWPETPLAEFIPHPVFSVQMGMRKPEPQMYLRACELNGIEPARAVYVGDGDSNELPGALVVGLCPILVDRGEESAFRTQPHRKAEVVVKDLREVLELVGVGGKSEVGRQSSEVEG